MVVAAAAALAGFAIGFGFWRWVLGDRNWLEATIVALPLAALFGFLVPAVEDVMAAATRQRAEAAEQGRPDDAAESIP